MTVGRALLLEQRRAVQSWVDSALPVLGLTDWRVIVSDEPPGDYEANASITPTYGRKVAVLCVDAGPLESGTDEDLVETLVHELCHLHHGDLLGVLEEVLADVDPVVARLVTSTLRRQVELLVDGVAVLLARGPLALPSVTAIRSVPVPR